MEYELIIVGIGGLILAVLTYFAGVYRTEKQYKSQEKGKRIEDVVNRYMEFRRTNKTAGLDGLQKSGIATLNSDAEIREVVDLIIKYGENDPLQRSALPMDKVDLKVFFTEAAKKRVNLVGSNELIEFVNKLINL